MAKQQQPVDAAKVAAQVKASQGVKALDIVGFDVETFDSANPMESGTVVDGDVHISYCELSGSGKHLKVTCVRKGEPHRFVILMRPDAVPPAAGTKIKDMVVARAIRPDGGNIEPEWKNTPGGRFCYYTLYYLGAGEVTRPASNGVLGIAAEQLSPAAEAASA